MSGYVAAALAVAIWAAYPVATRAALTGTFEPHELVLLRFGAGGLLFVPWLLLRYRSIERRTWRRGVPLMLFQGAGMAALVLCGLQLAPASHAAALGPGVSPAWVAFLGFAVFGLRPAPRVVAGAALCAAGVLVLAWWTTGTSNLAVLAADGMFLAASALGALYVLQLRRWGIEAMEGAAIVTLYSALLVVPLVLLLAPGVLARPSIAELAWQVLWQGVLIGCLSLIALNHAIAALGAGRTSALVAFVPVLSAILAAAFLGEVPSSAELLAFIAISAGVSLGATAAPRVAYAGSPAVASAAAKRSA